MTRQPVSMDELIARVKRRSNIHEAGMILCHNGIVRNSDRSGKNRVASLRVRVNGEKIQEIRSWGESQPGIVAVEIEALEGEFHVGEDLLYVVVAGDIRENVFQVTREVVEKIKAEAVSKTEVYCQ